MLKRIFRPRNVAMALAVLFVAIQAVPVWAWQTNPPVTGDVAWTTPEAASIARRACYDCHSNETVWPWYSKIAPASWLITYDVIKGRSELNFSQPLREPHELAQEIAEVVRSGEMPPRQYLLLHPEAKLTPQEVQALVAGTPGGAGLQVEQERDDD
ncbi:heme-binding domain-containing protein [uncultured Chloroflexus sp.]|uniref:heme-binding domain-containing protein n=1 Tax=uncultured Chloroflexus sp. TaxID=214040 RepID=UPI0026081D15|nr:heme-binding domain-containing protein [uncultured Chloroflexus sp.]